MVWYRKQCSIWPYVAPLQLQGPFLCMQQIFWDYACTIADYYDYFCAIASNYQQYWQPSIRLARLIASSHQHDWRLSILLQVAHHIATAGYSKVYINLCVERTMNNGGVFDNIQISQPGTRPTVDQRNKHCSHAVSRRPPHVFR